MNQKQNVTQQPISFPEVIIYRSQRAIFVPQDVNNDGVMYVGVIPFLLDNVIDAALTMS